MAGSGMTTWRRGWRSGRTNGASADTEDAKLETGYGTPTHAAPEGTVYVKLDATMGSSSHYRRASGSWVAMSDA